MTEPKPLIDLPTLLKLIKQWREYADQQGAIYASGIEMCADELLALIEKERADPRHFRAEVEKRTRELPEEAR